MNQNVFPNKTARLSPLVLADQLITLAQEADRAGYRAAASRLVGLAYAVLEPNAAKPSQSSAAGA